MDLSLADIIFGKVWKKTVFTQKKVIQNDEELQENATNQCGFMLELQPDIVTL